MFYITNEEERYFAGGECGCNVFKGHYTRAVCYSDEETTLKDIEVFGLDYCQVIEGEL